MFNTESNLSYFDLETGPFLPMNHLEISTQGEEAEHRNLVKCNENMDRRHVMSLVDELSKQNKMSMFLSSSYEGFSVLQMSQAIGRMQRSNYNTRIYTIDHLHHFPNIEYESHKVSQEVQHFGIDVGSVFMNVGTERHYMISKNIAENAEKMVNSEIRKITSADWLNKFLQKNDINDASFLNLFFKTFDFDENDELLLARELAEYIENSLLERLQERGIEVPSLNIYSVFFNEGLNKIMSSSFLCSVVFENQTEGFLFEVKLAEQTVEHLVSKIILKNPKFL